MKRTARNGLALCSLHEKAFDAGQLTILPTYVVRVSDGLLANSDVPVGRAAFRDLNGSTMTLPTRFLPGADLLRYHNNKIFNG